MRLRSSGRVKKLRTVQLRSPPLNACRAVGHDFLVDGELLEKEDGRLTADLAATIRVGQHHGEHRRREWRRRSQAFVFVRLPKGRSRGLPRGRKPVCVESCLPAETSVDGGGWRMASGASSLDSSGSSTNGTLPRNYGEHGSARDYDGLKAQCDKAMHELQMLRRQHSETGRRCDHAVKELEYYRGQHRAAMAQLEAAAQETSTLRTRCADLAADKQRLERDADIRLQESLCGDGGSGDFMSPSARKHDSLKDDYETLRKRCEDLAASHAAALAKLELAQEEANRAKKQCDEVSAERGAAVRERNGLKQQCTAAIRQWDIALRERNEYREALGKVQQQHEEAVKEINQAMAVRMKASKDLKRLAEERNAAMQEYSLIMSERDTVHKEMEKLSDDLAKAFAQTQALEAANKQLADEKKAVSYQQETLRREIASALTDRDKALKECNDLREKFGELSEESARDALGLDMHTLAREREGPRQDLAGTEALAGSRDRKTQRERVDDLDLANLELERMRKQLDKLVAELLEASQEAEVSKRRRDWAFCERDKIVLERESIRTLCDRLRKERDRAVSDLAEALRDSDDLKKQRNDTAKELTDLRERVEAEAEEAAGAFRSLGRCDPAAVTMMDPASDTDDWNTEVLDIDLSVLSADQPLGLSLSGGRGGDGPPVVSAVAANSPAAGRLLPGDRLVRVNNLDCSNMSQRVLLETVRSSGRAVSLVLRRPHMRRPAQKAPLTLQTTRVLTGPRGDHGLTLSAGVYVSGVSAGSPSAQAGLSVGQRVVSLDGRSLDGLNSRELAALLAGPRTQLTLQTLGPPQPARDLDALDKPRKDNANTSLKMVHRCSQTEAKPGGGAEGKAGAWEMIREKIEIVTGRSRPWKGREAEEKALLEKKRMSSPGAGAVGADPEDAIAELDHVIESYHRAGNKRSRRRQSKEKSGGTWPKSRSGPLIEVGTGTIIHPRKHKERLPLSVLLNDPPVYPRSRPTRACAQPAAPALCGQQSFSPTSFAALLGDKGIAAGPSETSIDLGSPGPQMSDPRRRSKYASDSESPVDSLASASRVHSALYGGLRLASFPHPHPHPRSDGHAPIAPLGYASSRSGDSGCDARGFCFEPPYSLPPLTSGQHSHSPTAEAMLFHKTQSLLSAHSHPGREDPAMLPYQQLEGGTFPRQRESPRIRIPSNQSVASKGNKVSSGSIERGGSERNSPMPTFHVEVLSPGHRAAKRNSLPDYCFTQNWRPAPGELRRVHIDKSVEPLGIQISCIEAGGVFVSTVNEHSLASQVGLQVGDQLLEVCGINMRSATYQLAANVLRQCGNSITMLVQYSPDKYHELDEESGGSSSEGEGAAASRSGSPTPCNSPAPAHKRRTQPQPGAGSITNGNQTSTLSRQKPLASRSQHESVDSSSGGGEPRALLIETRRRGNLGISLVGGNAVGIFVHSVQADSLAHCAGLRTGDQILEYNGTDLRHATAEEAAYELAKPADKVTLLAHYKLERYHEIKDKPGDGFYVRTLFDRTGDLGADSLQLRFRKDNVLFVDNTMFNGVPGSWRAWFVDEDARRQQCGIIPSKYKVEEELLLRRSLGDLESEGARRGTTSARRSFFRRKKPVRGSSRDSKELASFSSTNLGWYSDSGALGDELALCSYQRVERLDHPAGQASLRPVLVLGALADCVQDKLLQDFPDRFSRCVPELMQCPLAMVEKGLHENLFVDYRKKGAYFECTTLSAVKEMCDKPSSHCVLDVSLAAMERLHRHQIYPIVLLIKFKSTKQVKEVKDTRFPQDKVSAKAAKEMYEHALKIEAEYKHYISAVIPAGVNVAYMCTQIKAAVDAEQNKTLWVPCGTM